MDENNCLTVTVTDNKKLPQEGLTVIVKGDLGQSAQGQTDEDGQLALLVRRLFSFAVVRKLQNILI